MTEISHNFRSLSLSVASLHVILVPKYRTARHSIEIQNGWPPGEAVKSVPKLSENISPGNPEGAAQQVPVSSLPILLSHFIYSNQEATRSLLEL